MVRVAGGVVTFRVIALKAYRFQQLIALPGRSVALTVHGRVDKLARLMSGLPQYFEPIRLAERGEAIVGDLVVSQMPRLRQSLHDDSGTVHVHISCEPAELGAIRIHGSLSTTLKVECQRCLGAFDLPLNVSIDARAMTETGSVAELDREADVIMLGEDNQVHVASLVEDELILSLPIAALHPAGQCPAVAYQGVKTQQRENPFAALKQLKLKKD
jgi:uncharacterized protein